MQIKKSERFAKRVVHFLERRDDELGIHFRHEVGLGVGDFLLRRRQVVDRREAAAAAAAAEKLAVERREEPGLGLRLVAESVALGGPDKEGLLREVARVGWILRQTQRKAVERGVVCFHESWENLILHRGWEHAVAGLFPTIYSFRVTHDFIAMRNSRDGFPFRQEHRRHETAASLPPHGRTHSRTSRSGALQRVAISDDLLAGRLSN